MVFGLAPLAWLAHVGARALQLDAHLLREICGDMGRYGEIWGDMGRYGEIWGDMGRYGEIWGDVAPCSLMRTCLGLGLGLG